MASILIIDDDPTLLTQLNELLSTQGHRVQSVSNADQAGAEFAEQRPDLVILEPRISNDAGWDLLPQLAAERPVFVLSRAGHEEDVVRGFAAGAIEYVTKPYRSEELVARVRVRLEAAAMPALSIAEAPIPAAAPRVSTTTPLRAPERSSRRRDDDDNDVFMSDAEEMALLRTTPPPPKQRPAAVADEIPDALGAQLHAERLRRQMTLVQVENDLKIRMSYLQAIEDEKFTLLPRGPAAIQMVRQYAEYLHLDANSLAERFRQDHYVEPSEPLPALGGRRLPRSLPRWLISLLAALLAISITLGVILWLDPTFLQQVPRYLSQLWEQLRALFPQ